MQHSGRPLLLLLAVCVTLIQLTCQDTRKKRQILSEQPRLLTENGNLIFQSGATHNITFRSGANSGIYMNTFELNSVVQMVTANSNNISRITSRVINRERRFDDFRRNVTRSTITLNYTLEQVRDTIRRLSERESEGRSSIIQTIVVMQNKLNELETAVQTIQRLLSVNDCASGTQCQNGGTCIDAYNGYTCLCPPNWRGNQCETDVNECQLFIGTGDGCQNGGICINTPGSFSCRCTHDWYGLRCTEQFDDCRGSNPQSMCGPGNCVNLARTQPGQPKYTCNCYPGYTLSTISGQPNCVDIDECSPTSGHRYPCSTVPHVNCQNLPGYFLCGPCPQGYSGNGSYCALSDRCLINNGGCHLNALCHASDGYPIRCECRIGYVGHGFGPNGCISQSSSAACISSPCQNGGMCIPHGSNAFVCSCAAGYTGATCDTIVSPCSSSPCQNNGACIVQNSSFVCNCTGSYTGFNCEQTQYECGPLVGEVGSYKYPEDGGYGHYLRCSHLISTVPGKILKLNFTDFDLESGHLQSCYYDYIEVFDGPSRQSFSFGQFCGTSLRGRVFRSSQNQMLLYFHTDSSDNGDGFRVTWTSEVPDCGGLITGQSNGVISSPNYPGTFPPLTRCLWIISVTPGKNIELQLNQVSLDCSNAYIDIRNGEDESALLLRKVCGSNVPSRLVTSGPSTFIKFVSNYTTAHYGFSISYAEAGTSCGGQLHGIGSSYEGELISPQRLNAEPQNCAWSILVPDRNYISLSFSSFQQSCQTSRLTVYDGINFAAPLISSLCGSSIPTAVNSTGNAMYIEWRASSTLPNDNFFAHWTGLCGGKLIGDRGVLSTPTIYTSFCTYQIEVPAGKTILLSFTNVSSHHVNNCNLQAMSVYEGDSVNAPVIRAVNCSDIFPTHLRSRDNKMLIIFEARNGFGFTANFEAEINLGCVSVLYGNNGSFQSPGFPNNYHGGMNCTWYIYVNDGYRIKLIFPFFQLENDCTYDYVDLYDSDTISEEHRIGRYCGTRKPPEVMSSGNTIVINMVTDDLDHFTGFQASYSAIHESITCGRIFLAPTGVITSPNYPNQYPSYRDCEWTITVAAGNQIVLNISYLNLHDWHNCQYQFLEIRNGGFSTSSLITRLCGYRNQIEPIISHSNRLYLKFSTAYYSPGEGFYLNYYQQATGCGGQLSASTGSFESPHYPDEMRLNADCEWKIHAPEGSRITLSFESTIGIYCQDFFGSYYSSQGLTVHYGSRKKQRFCGNQAPSPLTFNDNNLVVKYIQTGWYIVKGFRATYHVDCNNDLLNGFEGAIESPNFPNSYQGPVQCSWTIKVPLGNRINAQFATFNLKPDTICRQDYVQITGSNLTNTKFCGDSVPLSFQSTLNEMTIQFKSESSSSYQGFRLEWAIEGCGAKFTNNSGGFTSPNYPRPYDPNKICIWEIMVDPELIVQLTILDLDVESDNNCTQDALEVYSHGVADDDPNVRICHKQTTSQIVTSDGNRMLVIFKSDSGVQSKGFNATFSAIQRVCGADYSLRSATIRYTLPRNRYYEACHWSIKVEAGHVVNLTFVNFDIDCGQSGMGLPLYISTGSSYNEESPCMTPNKTFYLSSSNEMHISLNVEWWHIIHGGSFEATYTTGCGGTINADNSGEITSPFFPHNYSPYSDCVWTIISSTQAVYLTFLHMNITDLSQYGNCQFDYVSVITYDSNSTYCGQNIPTTIYSQTSTLQVHFHSTTTSASGFRAKYSSVLTSCGGDLVSMRIKRFASPHYPLDYPDDTECVWQISPSPGNTIEINFLTFLLTGNRSNDYLEIYTPDVNGRIIDRWFGNNVPGNLTGLQGAWILFRSDEHSHSQGFLAEYTQSCGGELTGERGQISSLWYPSNYPPNSDCRWTIIASNTFKRVHITFNAIDLESEVQGQCSQDYIQVFEGVQQTGREIKRYCGSNVSSPFYSTTNEVTIKFVSNSQNQYSGFLLTWAAEDYWLNPQNSSENCNGSFAANSSLQVLTSPGYPANYANHLRCYQTITAPLGYSVSVKILNLSVEVCADNIAFYNGDDFQNSNKIITICHSSDVGRVITSRSNILGLKFYSDFLITSSGYQLSYQQVCGSYIKDVSSGIIASTNYPTNYPANETCTWQVTAKTGKTIELTFSQPFDVENYQSCQHDFLKLLNGGYSTSPPLIANGSSNTNGVYCGSVAPPNLKTSSNQLFAQFVSDDSGSGHGFSLTFTELSLACGGTFTLTTSVTEGNFTSPNYPSNYPHNVDCIWIIIAPPFQRVRVDFVETFSIEGFDSCRFNYVEFRDGGTALAPIIDKPFCGENLPSTIYSSSNLLFVRFRTNHNETHEGFKAKYSIATCGGRIVGSNGTITSPDSPSNCDWEIFGITGHYISFTFETQTMPRAQNCVNYVEIRDGNATDRVIFNSCNDSFIISVDTSDSRAHVKFTSNQRNQGFRLTFRSSLEVCGGDLHGSTGVITSPNFPGLYAHDRTCVWNIEVDPGNSINLTFTDFTLEGDTHCSNDYVDVFNGLEPDSPRLGKFCGVVIPRAVQSTGNTMKVKFHTNENVTNGGFRATYSSDNPIACGGLISEPSGYIVSPQLTDPHNAQCIWRVSPSIHSTNIRLSFLQFDLEHHTNCNYDFLEIREGVDRTGFLVGHYCGTNKPDHDIIIEGGYVWLMYKTDRNIASVGFNISFTASICGGNIYWDDYLSSPHDPPGSNFPISCLWMTHMPDAVKVTPVRFNLSCTDGFLLIQNGYLPDSPVVGRYCNSSTPYTFTSASNQIRLTSIIYQPITEETGFLLNIRSETLACGGTIHAVNGTLTSPNYPRSYPHDEECRWEINVNQNSYVLLKFDSPFDMAAHDLCEHDYVQALDVQNGGTEVSLGKWCSSQKPPDLESSSTKMVVVFRSDHVTNGLGFSAKWTSKCGGTYRDEAGQITSPNYPRNYPSPIECKYSIRPGSQKLIKMRFNDLQLARETGYPWWNWWWSRRFRSSLNCLGSDSITVTGNNVNRQLCRYDGYTEFHSQGSMNFTFTSSLRTTAKGFSAQYESIDCGGILTNSSGFISTTGFHENFTSSYECFWNITVEPDKLIRLKITDLILFSSSYQVCRSYLKIFDGPNGTDPLTGNICRRENAPDVIRSLTNYLYLKYSIGSNRPTNLFTANYWSTYGPSVGCGGSLNQVQGSFSAPDVDHNGQYEPDLDCWWYITVGLDKIISLNITNIRIDGQAPCETDYLLVYDGLDDVELGKYCGNQQPVSLSSSHNMLRVIFVSDSDRQDSGFNLTYSERDRPCGGFLNATNITQVISFPGNLTSNNQPVLCNWIIDTGVQGWTAQVNISDRSCSNGATLLAWDDPMRDAGQRINLCDPSIHDPFYSLFQRIRMYFNGTTSARFQLNYSIADCNRTYSQPSGRIMSAGFPYNYRHGHDCIYRIRTAEDTSISIYFRRFSLENAFNCRWDFLKINSTNTEATYCGHTIPAPLFINNSRVDIQFKTDDSISGDGFDVTYISSTQGPGCGGNITGHNFGIFTSPGFPSISSVAQTCTWLISPHDTLYFHYVQQSPSLACNTDYVAVYQGTSETSLMISRYCNEVNAVSPVPFSSTIRVQFVSSGNSSAPVFKFAWAPTVQKLLI